MGSQDQSNRGSTKRTQYQSLYNDYKREKNIKPIIRWTTQSKINCKVKFKIYNIIFLYPKERWITMTGIKLLEIKQVYNKE